MLATDLLIAFRNLVLHTKRTVFLGGALAVVTALLVLLNGLTTGVHEALLTSATTLITGHVNVSGFFKPSPGVAVPLVFDYVKVLERVKREVPELDYWVQRGRGFAKVVSDRQSMDVGLGGIDITHEPGFREVVKPVEGSLDDLAKPGTILLFKQQARRLNVKVGDSLTLSAPTPRGVFNTVDLRVVAIAPDIGFLSAFYAYVPSETLLKLYQLKPGTTGAIQLYLKDETASLAVAARLRAALGRAGWKVMDDDPDPYWEKALVKVNHTDWVGEKLDVDTWHNETENVRWALSTIDVLVWLLLFILLSIVLTGIMSTMWIAIRERTREIGTLRAIGMHRRKVLWLFLLEALMLGVLGSSAGALLGAALGSLLNSAHLAVPEAMQVMTMSDRLTLSIHAVEVLRGMGLITLLTVLASVYPSLRAVRLEPVTAMHHIG